MRVTYLKCQILMFFLFYGFVNINPDLMVKDKKERTNVKDVLHKNLKLDVVGEERANLSAVVCL